MADSSTATNTILLERLFDPKDSGAWRPFFRRYEPLVVGFAMRNGVPRHDAELVAQDTLVAFAEAYRANKYDRAKAKLRTWLFGFARKHVLQYFGQKQRSWDRRQKLVDGAGEGDVATRGFLERHWDAEWEERVREECFRIIREVVEPNTWQAFEEYALKRRKPEDVARELDCKVNRIYEAKRRVRLRYNELRPQVERDF